MENGLHMVDMHFIPNEVTEKYNLEKENMNQHGPFFFDFEYTWKIKNSDWWVIGINTQTNTVYAQIDYLDPRAIQDLNLNDYVLVNLVEEFQPGMISTRDMQNPTEDIKDFIKQQTVYELKYVG